MHLRTPISTLEPDDAFVARLSALAAAGAPTARPRSPVTGWRVALAAAAVAAVLVGVAWLAGLSPTGSPEPAPPPATSPSTPQSTHTSTALQPSATRARDPQHTSSGTTSPPVAPPPARPSGASKPPAAPATKKKNGPNEHAGDHPNAHATTKSDNGKAGHPPKGNKHR